MSKQTAIIDPTTPEGTVAARNYFFTHLIHALVDAPASVRNLVGRCKMHEFFGLYKPKMVQGAHWHSANGLFVRYQQYRQAEAIFHQARYAFYPEKLPAALGISPLLVPGVLTNPKSEQVKMLGEYGAAWAKDVSTDKHCLLLDNRYPNATITTNSILVAPKGGGELCRGWVQQVFPDDGLAPLLYLSYSNDVRAVLRQLRDNCAQHTPFFVYDACA